jgi:alkanesulfonate monooxygenase
MPVEFIGMIGTKDQSETGAPAARSSTATTSGGSPAPTRTPGSTGCSSATLVPARRHPGRRLRRRAHRAARLPGRAPPGFVAPTLAARTFATLDQFTGGRIAVHIITGGSDAEQRRDGDYLSKDERYARTDEYLDIVKQAWTSEGPFELPRQVLPGRGLLLRASARRSSRGSRCTSAARPRRPTGSAASTPTSTPCGASRWPRPSRADRLGQRGRQGGGPHRPPRHQRQLPAHPRPDRGTGLGARAPHPRDHQGEHRGLRAQWRGPSGAWAGPAAERGSQRLLAAAAKGELHDRALWTPLAAATGAAGNSTALVGTPETVAQALLDYVDIGVTTCSSAATTPTTTPSTTAATCCRWSARRSPGATRPAQCRRARRASTAG